MEAHLFRFFVQEAGPALVGHRIEKVYSPYPDVWTLKLASRLHVLLITTARKKALFLSQSRPDNPPSPSPRVQWWRKRLQKRRIISFHQNWPQRQLALELSSGQQEWLLLDLKKGLSLINSLPAGFDKEPAWPGLEDILSDSSLYRSYPQLTPPLRRTLNQLELERAQNLLDRLKSGRIQQFYGYAREGRLAEVLPYQRPDETQEVSRVYDSAREAAHDLGWSIVVSLDDSRALQEAKKSSERRRLEKLLARLDEDETRLRAMAGLRAKAEVIKANLFRLEQDQRVSYLDLTDEQGHEQHIELDPTQSILENMQHLFTKARKGERGLVFISRRRTELQSALAGLETGHQRPSPTRPGHGGKGSSEPGSSRFQGLKVHEFVSQDGFTIVRGKDQKANHALLTRGAKPFDFWFHAENGPGAHVVLRRDHENQDVPQGSLQQAAILAGLSSFQARDSQARVLMALVKHVHPIKGAAPGQVRIDRVQESLVVPLDPDLEARLRKW